jgi:hypothetical protein
MLLLCASIELQQEGPDTTIITRKKRERVCVCDRERKREREMLF